MKDCTTCKYGYEDERLGIPMCHHPKRFSEDCVNFNMHEEKEIKESEKPISNSLEEAAGEYADKHGFRVPYDGLDNFYDDVDVKASKEGFLAGAAWRYQKDRSEFAKLKAKTWCEGFDACKEQMMKDAVKGEVYKFGEIAYVKECNNAELTKYLSQFNNGDKVKIIVIHETDIR